MPPHPSLRDTFSPRAKALMAVPLFIQRTYGSLPGDVSTAQRTTRCFAQHDIIFNLQYMVVCLPLRFAEVSELKERNSTANCSLTVSGVARCCHEATSERGRGWVGYLPQDTMPEVKRASTRSHSWQFLDGTPYTNYRTSAFFIVGARPVPSAPFLIVCFTPVISATI